MDEIEHVLQNIYKAEMKYENYNSPHEGYGYICEELDELWDEIKKRSPDYKKMYLEASDVACTSIRFMKMCRGKDHEF